MQQVFSRNSREFTVEIRQPGKEASFYRRCGSHSVARLIAKTLTQRGSRAIVRPARPTDPVAKTQYSVLIYDCQTESMISPGLEYGPSDALQFWRQWQVDPESSVVVLWPNWAPIPKCFGEIIGQR